VTSGFAASPASLLQRLGGLGGLLAFELVAISIWLDTRALSEAQGLTALVAERGAEALRFIVGSALIVLIFGHSSPTLRLRQLSAELVDRGIAWPLLVAHLCLAVLFTGISSILFGTRLPAAFDNALAGVWVATGVAAVAVAALAFTPFTHWRRLFRSVRPVLTFAFAVSVAGLMFGWLALTYWQPMSRLTLWVAYVLLRPFAPDVSADPSTLIIGGPEFSVFISQECSGYEGLGLILVFTAAWLWFHRADWRFPHALVIVPIGLAAAWMFNCVRIAGLVYIGISGAPDIALGGFHSQAGWLGFNAVALGICLVTRRVAWLATTQKQPAASATSNPTAVYLMPFLAMLAGAMVSQLASGDFEWTYGIRVIATAAALWYFRDSYRAFDWRAGWPSVGLGVVVFAIWISLEPLVTGGMRTTMPLALNEAPDYGRIAWLVLRLLGAVVVVPLAEELAFRGFLLRRFVSADFELVSRRSVTWIAILLSSLAFGVLHGDRWLAGTIAGGIYALAFLRRGSVGDAAAAHATTNVLIATWVLVIGNWQLW
jgi:exosortase E/protease (VPEID-CTERM system)